MLNKVLWQELIGLCQFRIPHLISYLFAISFYARIENEICEAGKIDVDISFW